MRKIKRALESTMLPRMQPVLKMKMVKRQNTKDRIQETGVRIDLELLSGSGPGSNSKADTDPDSDGFWFLQ
jgi:hypothetical protein